MKNTSAGGKLLIETLTEGIDPMKFEKKRVELLRRSNIFVAHCNLLQLVRIPTHRQDQIFQSKISNTIIKV